MNIEEDDLDWDFNTTSRIDNYRSTNLSNGMLCSLLVQIRKRKREISSAVILLLAHKCCQQT